MLSATATDTHDSLAVSKRAAAAAAAVRQMSVHYVNCHVVQRSQVSQKDEMQAFAPDTRELLED